MKTGRNDPCPCGSGKKYKQCCLKKERMAQHKAAEASSEGAAGKALDWLNRHHRSAVMRWIDEVWFGDLSAEEHEVIQGLEPEMREMLETNMFEYLLADGRLRSGGKKQFVMDMVLGVGGALMSSGQQQYLQQLRGKPLRLYEIRELRPGEGVLLHDLMHEDAGDVWVRERSGSRHARQWSIWAARIMDHGDHQELSGAIYDIPRHTLDDLLAKLERMRADAFIEHKDEMCALAIAGHWMKLLAAPPLMPNMIDAATGEAMAFITDHYRVNDWAALAARLAAEEDVEGDEQEGWNRLQAIKHDMMRSLAAINIGERKDRVELFTRSIAAADPQKEWFDDVAGDAVLYMTREISDPLALLQHQEKKPPIAGKEMPEDLQRKVVHEYKQKHYANWADEPLPALDGKTPRQTVKTAAGRKAVVALLKEFENREDAAHPFDFGFLWDALGLEKGQ